MKKQENEYRERQKSFKKKYTGSNAGKSSKSKNGKKGRRKSVISAVNFKKNSFRKTVVLVSNLNLNCYNYYTLGILFYWTLQIFIKNNFIKNKHTQYTQCT